MKEETREARKRQIENAAYALVEERGYARTSMLSIASRAGASNETLYRWYGDKVGLFKALVANNAMAARQILETSLKESADLEATLRSFGPTLLQAILQDRAVALNRAAAVDPSGELGRALAEAGRETIAALLQKVFKRQRPQGAFTTFEDMTQTYLSLLLGDRQIRRVIGTLPAPTKADCKRISDGALKKFLLLLKVRTIRNASQSPQKSCP